ncbi:MAG: ribosome-associated translation inhibitor RaiA [Alphaproteobacteria bacterium]|nr:MAG: ribosome-associated translation inhibitor RaiA [Alphaproteobacteria bacterium]
MEFPLEITFHNMDRSSAVESVVRDKVAKLAHYYDRIVSCRVVIEAPHRHHHKGKLYAVRIDISVPGRELVVNRNGPQDHAHEDVYVAIRDAFKAAVRQLEDYARKIRGKVKKHPPKAEPAPSYEAPSSEGSSSEGSSSESL